MSGPTFSFRNDVLVSIQDCKLHEEDQAQGVEPSCLIRGSHSNALDCCTLFLPLSFLVLSSIIYTCHHFATASRFAEHVTSRAMWSHIHCQDTYAFHWLSAFRVLVFDQWLTRYVTRHVIAHTLSRHTRISLAVSMVMEWRRRWHHCFVTWPKDLVIVLSHDRRVIQLSLCVIAVYKGMRECPRFLCRHAARR